MKEKRDHQRVKDAISSSVDSWLFNEAHSYSQTGPFARTLNSERSSVTRYRKARLLCCCSSLKVTWR